MNVRYGSEAVTSLQKQSLFHQGLRDPTLCNCSTGALGGTP
jgi:hypothetical protein